CSVARSLGRSEPRTRSDHCPDRRARHRKIASSQRVAHPPTIAIALAWVCGLHYFERNAPVTERYAQRLIDLSKEQNLPAWGAAGTIFHGWALTHATKGAAIDEILHGLAAAQTAGKHIPVAHLSKVALADAYLERGAAEEGLRVIDETLAGMAVTGERVWHSEFHRLKGELFLVRSSSNNEAAETWFRQALEIARVQGARSWQMRAATSLGRLLARQNRANTARQIASDLYDWFTGGLETPDPRA